MKLPKELENMLYEIERRGNRITTWELNERGMPMQYQRVLKQLRERLKMEKGWELTFAEKIKGQKGNSIYHLLKHGQQKELLNG